MRRKVFVSYKYSDRNVQFLIPGCSGIFGLTARDYVTVFENKCKIYDLAIYKGEDDNEDLSYLADSTIWEKLKDRIYDSSVTVLFISPNMYDFNKAERNQWIPQEIYYSLRHKTRDGRTSYPNALLYVILPDISGSYDYFKYMKQFIIVKNNCNYAYIVKWESFVYDIIHQINKAIAWKSSGNLPYVMI